jgi:glutamate/tyrosine decarboxylase-like PLP-dependent enzyme
MLNMKSSVGSQCNPEQVALKSFFLGPQSENATWLRAQFLEVIDHWFHWRRKIHPSDGKAISLEDQSGPLYLSQQHKVSVLVKELLELYEMEVPKHSPRYIGHMVSEISLPAMLGHVINLLHNPNITSDEVAVVGRRVEKEAIRALALMLGFNAEMARGHFTSGGTVANYEALWRARYRLDHWLSLGAYLVSRNLEKLTIFEASHMGWERFRSLIEKHQVKDEDYKAYSCVKNNNLRAVRKIEKVFSTAYDGPIILVPANKHYSWQKAINIFGYGEEAFWQVDLCDDGKLDATDLSRKIDLAKNQNRPILMVVGVCGTTEMGEIDPLDEIAEVLHQRKSQSEYFWFHVDAAYGGFFASLLPSAENETLLGQRTVQSLKALSLAHSITIDPHKLGYVPYSCGAIIVNHAESYIVSAFTAKYLEEELEDFSNAPWALTMEGSRSGSGACATWMSEKALGFHPEGFGRIITRTISTKRQIEEKIKRLSSPVVLAHGADTNILCFTVAFKGEKLSIVNERVKKLYRNLIAKKKYSVTKTTLETSSYDLYIDKMIRKWSGEKDDDKLVMIRVVVMNPFFGSKETSINYVDDLAAHLEEQIKLVD